MDKSGKEKQLTKVSNGVRLKVSNDVRHKEYIRQE